MKKNRIGSVVVGVSLVVVVLLLVIAVSGGLALQSSVRDCVAGVRHAEAAAAEQQRTQDPKTPRQNAYPAQPDHHSADASDFWKPWIQTCRWPGLNVDQAIAMGGLTLALYSFVISVFFGSLAVLGIFLTYTLARDEFKDRRRL